MVPVLPQFPAPPGTATGRWSRCSWEPGRPHRRPAILLYDDVSLTGIDITGDQRFPRLLDGVVDHCGPQSDQGGAHPLLSC
jgi:hypothetical protein